MNIICSVIHLSEWAASRVLSAVNDSAGTTPVMPCATTANEIILAGYAWYNGNGEQMRAAAVAR